MVVNAALLLATLFSLTNQTPDLRKALQDNRCRCVQAPLLTTWQTYQIYEDCPLLHALGFTKAEYYEKLFPDNDLQEKCICEGNYAFWPLTGWNHGDNHKCSRLSYKATQNDIKHFLRCINPSSKKYLDPSRNRYTLTIPTHYSFELHECDPLDTTPRIQTKYSTLLASLKTDPRCNVKLSEKLRAQKLELRGQCRVRDCKQKNPLNVFLKQRRKKNHR